MKKYIIYLSIILIIIIPTMVIGGPWVEGGGVIDFSDLEAADIPDLSDTYQPLDTTNLSELTASSLVSGTTTQATTSNADPYTLTVGGAKKWQTTAVTLTGHADDVDLVMSKTNMVTGMKAVLINGAANTFIIDTIAGDQQTGYLELESGNVAVLIYNIDRWHLIAFYTDVLYMDAINMSAGIVEMPNKDATNLTAIGQLAYDTDGWWNSLDASGTTEMAKHDFNYASYVIIQPDNAGNTIIPFGLDNKSGTTMYLQRIWVESDVDNSGCTLVSNYYNNRTSSGTTMVGLYATTDGTGVYTQDITRDGITSNAVGPGYGIYVVHDATDIGDFKVTVEYYYDGNID